MIWVMLGLLLATMLLGIPILLCIALIGFIGIAAEPGVADAAVDVRKARLFATLGIGSATETLPFAFAAGLDPRHRN